MFRPLVSLLLSLTATAVLAFAACGGNGDANPASTATPPATTGNPANGTGADGDLPPGRVRLGYFPNVTHAQPLIGVSTGLYQEALGSSITLEARTFNAGGVVIESLFAGEVDVSYIGPNPAINGYVQSRGDALRIVSGSASAGARFIVRPDAGIETAADLDGKRIATPQLGNTQDVALRAYLIEQGLNTIDNGGTVLIQPVSNADAFTLFQRGDIDGAWVPEPWASRLELEAGGIEFLDERDLWPDGEFVTTHVIVRTQFLEERPDIVKRLLEAHIEVTEAINADPEGSKELVNAAIEDLTTVALPEATMNSAWSNLTFTYDPIPSSLFASAADAYSLGFLQDEPDLDGIYVLELLNDILEANGLAPVGVER